MKTEIKKYNFLEFLQILSIDVVLGTIAIGYMATRILNVEANPYWWIILPLTVWVVYSIDHIIDSTKNKDHAVIYRHRFHYLNRRPILFMIMITGIITVFLSLQYLDPQIIILGLCLSVFIAFYFALIYSMKRKKSLLLQKELIIALVYTFGIFMAPLYWHGALPSFSVMIVIFNIFVLAWIEGIMISWFDYDSDIKDGHTSFTVIVGKRNTRRIMLIVHSILELVTITVLLTINYSVTFYALVITLIINFLLGLIIMFPDSYLSKTYHRLIGETVFFLPALVFFF